nr:hypothetical protein CFP56_07755 [Quercus suber]
MNSSVCYFPDGVTTGCVPCNPEAPNSACCAAGESCIGSGLCYSDNGGIYRGACTDKHWIASECANICLKDDGTWNAGAQGGGNFLVQCGGVGSDTPQWACLDGSGNANCDGAPSLRLGAVLQTNITGTTTPVSSVSNAPTTTVSVTATVTPPTTSATTVGIAVGVSLGCLLLFAAAAAVFYGRRWLATKKQLAQYERLPTTVPPYEQHLQKMEHPVFETNRPKAHHELSGEVQRAELGAASPGYSCAISQYSRRDIRDSRNDQAHGATNGLSRAYNGTSKQMKLLLTVGTVSRSKVSATASDQRTVTASRFVFADYLDLPFRQLSTISSPLQISGGWFKDEHELKLTLQYWHPRSLVNRRAYG